MPRKKVKPTPPWQQYVNDVLAGDILVGKWVRLACERHELDRKHGAERGLTFNAVKATEAINFFTDYLHHSKGEWAGGGFVLSGWQCFIIGSVFGWYKADGTRRFRQAHIAVARKNGKTTMLAGIGLYGMTLDGEPGADIYAVATKEEQAKISWAEAVRMVKASPDIKEGGVKTSVASIYVEATNSKFQALGADSKTLDGLNPHFGLVDEYHAHPNNGVYNVIKSGQGARRNPCMWVITTAGDDPRSECRKQQEFGEKVLQGLVPVETSDPWFFYMASLDPEDNWEDEKLWVKANPNLGVSVKLEFLQEEAANAKQMPGQLNTFLKYYMNRWVQQTTRYIPMDKWLLCAGPNPEQLDAKKLRREMVKRLTGRMCFAGLDLSQNIDVTALVLLFPPTADDPYWSVLVWFWVPKDNIFRRSNVDRVPYDVWEREGFITATEGNVIDYAFIRAQVNAVAKLFHVKELGYDKWNATQTSLELKADGCNVVEVTQGYASLSEPTKYLLTLVMNKTLAHGNNPVLNWMADNVAVSRDPAGNVKPDKEKARERIDGISALVNALQRAISNAGIKNAAPRIYSL